MSQLQTNYKARTVTNENKVKLPIQTCPEKGSPQQLVVMTTLKMRVA